MWRASLLLMLLLPLELPAHGAVGAYLRLDLSARPMHLRCDIALADLDLALGLNRDGDASLTWSEVRDRHPEILAYTLSRVRVSSARGPCSLTPGAQSLADREDRVYAVLPLTLDCGGEPPLRIDYGLMQDLDAGHHGLLTLIRDGKERSWALSHRRPGVDLSFDLEP